MSRIYFVYGTLRPGGRYWPNVEEFVVGYEPGCLVGFALYDLPEGYPAILPGEGSVFGDLLFIAAGDEERAQTVFDEIECCDPQDETESLYIRRSFDVKSLRQTRDFPAAIYVYDPNRAVEVSQRGTLVVSGDWREFTAEGAP